MKAFDFYDYLGGETWEMEVILEDKENINTTVSKIQRKSVAAPSQLGVA